VSGHWRGRAGNATIDVVLPSSPTDPLGASIEQVRDDAGDPDFSYVSVTIANPKTAAGPVSIAKVSFLTAQGVTITANEPHAFLAELQEAAATPAVANEVQRILAKLAPAAVAPGHTETFTYVTTTLLPNVKSVFVGTSFGSEPLRLVKTPRARRPSLPTSP